MAKDSEQDQLTEIRQRRFAYLEADVERLRSRLKALEWAGGDEKALCPVCQLMEIDGHRQDCWLAAELI
jgi:hypothetical protein